MSTGTQCKYKIGDKVWTFTYPYHSPDGIIEQHIKRATIYSIVIERDNNGEVKPRYRLEFEDGQPHGLNDRPDELLIFETKEECIKASTKKHTQMLCDYKKDLIKNREDIIRTCLKSLEAVHFEDIDKFKHQLARMESITVDDTYYPKEEISDLDYLLGVRHWVVLRPTILGGWRRML